MNSICSFEVAGQLFGLETGQVLEVIPGQSVNPVPLAPKNILGLLNLRGQILHVLDFRIQLGLPGHCRPEDSMFLILRSETQPIALAVDNVGEVIDVSDMRPETPPLSREGFGVTASDKVYLLQDRLLTCLDAERISNS